MPYRYTDHAERLAILNLHGPAHSESEIYQELATRHSALTSSRKSMGKGRKQRVLLKLMRRAGRLNASQAIILEMLK